MLRNFWIANPEERRGVATVADIGNTAISGTRATYNSIKATAYAGGALYYAAKGDLTKSEELAKTAEKTHAIAVNQYIDTGASAAGILTPGVGGVYYKAGIDVLKYSDEVIDSAKVLQNSSSLYNRGFNPEFYDAAGNPTQWKNPLTNQIEPLPAGQKIHKDHVFPKKEIESLPGFEKLTDVQKKEILNDPYNFQPLTASTNCSKGAKVCGTDNPWETYKGQELSPEYKTWLSEQQQEKKEYINETIQNYLK